MAVYRVCVLGCGHRGNDHLHGFRENRDRFEVVGLCDQNQERLAALANEYGVVNTYTDGERMLTEQKPDVFCFATMPDCRQSMVEMGIRHGVKAIAFEKPLSLTLAEAWRIRDLCRDAGIKAVVSHQQKYGSHYQAIKRIVDDGRIGEVHTIRTTAQAWLMQLGTHMIDYALWLNGGSPAQWVIGQAHGTGLFNDTHPSPDYVFGQFVCANGVRCIVDFGRWSPKQLDDNLFWVDDTLTAFGTHGYARMLLGQGWTAVTKDSGGEVLSGEGFFDPKIEQPLYILDLADWLDGGPVHPCALDTAFHGFEIAMALCLSSIERRIIELPLAKLPEEPVFEALKRLLPG